MFYDVNVIRIATATKTLRVEAGNREAAEGKPSSRRTTRSSRAAWSSTISRSPGSRRRRANALSGNPVPIRRPCRRTVQGRTRIFPTRGGETSC